MQKNCDIAYEIIKLVSCYILKIHYNSISGKKGAQEKQKTTEEKRKQKNGKLREKTENNTPNNTSINTGKQANRN